MIHYPGMFKPGSTTDMIPMEEIEIDPTLCVINFDKVKELEEMSEFTKELVRSFLNKHFEFLRNCVWTNEYAVIYSTLKEYDVLVREKSLKRQRAAVIANSTD